MTIQIDKVKGPLMHDHNNYVKGPVFNYRYGMLYNWFVASDNRIANTGWRVPTDTDGDTLMTYLGGIIVAGGKLKDTGNTYWTDPNFGATNISGFKGRGSGCRNYADGLFYHFKNFGWIWCSNQQSGISAWCFAFTYSNDSVEKYPYNKTYGLPIRLLRDAVPADGLDGTKGTYTGNDGEIYSTVRIGTQVWISENLCETQYFGGSLIPETTDAVTWISLATGARCCYDNIFKNAYDPGITTNNAIATWNGTDGRMIQNSNVIIADNGSIQGSASAIGSGVSVGAEFTGNGDNSFGVVGNSKNVPLLARSLDTAIAAIKRVFVKEATTIIDPSVGYGLYEEYRFPSKRSDHATQTLTSGKEEIVYTQVLANNESTEQTWYLLLNGALVPAMKLSGNGTLYLRNSSNTAWVQKRSAYASEIVVAPTSGPLTLKLETETYAGTITSANTFTVVLPTPVSGFVAESVLIFKIGATLPAITHPTGIVWRGFMPVLIANTSWTIVYEQVNTTGSTYEVWATAIKNV